jgi:carboxymethylenebutenolidase
LETFKHNVSQICRKKNREDEKMELQKEWIAYGENNRYLGYLAKPERVEEPLPAVLVLQEIWGVDEHIRDVADRFAAAGYSAFAPDLLAVNGKRPEPLTDERIAAYKSFMESLPPGVWHDEAARKEAMSKLPQKQSEEISETAGQVFGGMSRMAGYIEQVVESARYMRNDCPASKGRKVGSVGYCLGGGLSAQLAGNDPLLAGAVIYYGSAPKPEVIEKIGCPVLGFYGGQDARITNQVPEFAEAMKSAGNRFESHVYEGAQHAFFNDTRRSYSAAAARDAFARTLEFFREHLA